MGGKKKPPPTQTRGRRMRGGLSKAFRQEFGRIWAGVVNTLVPGAGGLPTPAAITAGPLVFIGKHCRQAVKPKPMVSLKNFNAYYWRRLGGLGGRLLWKVSLRRQVGRQILPESVPKTF